MGPTINKIRLDITLHMDDPRDLAIIKVLMRVDPRRRTKKFKFLAYDGIFSQEGSRRGKIPHDASQVKENNEDRESKQQQAPINSPAASLEVQAPAEYEPEIVDPAEFLDMIAKQASFFESKSWDGK